jgi:two-component system chemotaxis response regulator CheY
MKILVVDDDALQRKIIKEALSIGSYDVTALDNATTAKQLLEQDTVRFVITDWVMPDMDGLSFVRWIRSANITGYVYVMLLTSREETRDIEDGLNAGADDYIKKPFHPKELLARVAVGERILRLEEDLRKASERLKQQVLIDDLTELMNRRAIYQAGRQELARSRRDASPLSVLFLDLDKFKNINDTYGHLAGDEALKLTAHLLQNNIREYDLVGRWAGDEFVALLPDTNREQAAELGGRVLRAFNREAMLLKNGSRIILNASIGLFTWMPSEVDMPDLDSLVRLADEAMYKAKQSGGNRTLA